MEHCLICQAGRTDRPAIFQNERYCSEVCRKKLEGELPLTPKDLVGLDRTIWHWLVEIGQHAYLRDPGMGEVKDGDDNVIRSYPFQHEKTAKEGRWFIGLVTQRPRWHTHEGSGLKFPVDNVTQPGDETEVFRCAECGAERNGRYTNENRDEE